MEQTQFLEKDQPSILYLPERNIHYSSIHEAHEALIDRINECGFNKIAEGKYKPLYTTIAVEMNKDFDESMPNLSPEERMYFVLREWVFSVCKRDLFWMAKWMTAPKDAGRVHYVHKIVSDFLRIGERAIPESWRTHIKYKWRAEFVTIKNNLGEDMQIDVTPQLIRIPRGESKTVIFHSMGAVQNLMNDPLGKGLITHTNLKKVGANLSQIGQLLTSPYLHMIAPHIFSKNKKEIAARGGKWTKDKIDIAISEVLDDSVVTHNIRREPSITASSPGANVVGMHFDWQLDDDPVTDETSETETKIETMLDWYRNCFALTNIPGGKYPRRITDTYWYEECMNERILDEITHITIPLYFYEKQMDGSEKKIYTSPYYTERDEARVRKQWGQWFYAHACIEPMKRVGNQLDIGFDRIKHVQTMSIHELNVLKQRLVRVMIGDPAFSQKDKKMEDKQSKATILHLLRGEQVTYIYDLWQALGTDDDRSWKNICIAEAKDKEIDIFIQDAQGNMQGGLFKSTFETMIGALKRNIKGVPHTKSPLTNTSEKVKVANGVLKDYFLENEIIVVLTPETEKQMEVAIRQLSRISKGMDIIDCLVYGIADIDPKLELMSLNTRRRRKDKQKSLPLMPTAGIKIGA